MIYFRCPGCGYQIPEVGYMSVQSDRKCAHCDKFRFAEFIKIVLHPGSKNVVAASVSNQDHNPSGYTILLTKGSQVVATKVTFSLSNARRLAAMYRLRGYGVRIVDNQDNSIVPLTIQDDIDQVVHKMLDDFYFSMLGITPTTFSEDV